MISGEEVGEEVFSFFFGVALGTHSYFERGVIILGEWLWFCN